MKEKDELLLKILNGKQFYRFLVVNNLLDYLISKTLFLDEIYVKINYGQRAWHVKNNDYNIQICEICGEPQNWNVSHGKYSIHQKCLKSKIKKTYDEKYPNGKFKEIITEKTEKTCLEKYGVKNYSKTLEFKNKWKETQITKYGSIFTFTKEFQEKIEQNTNNTLVKRLPDHIKYKGYLQSRNHKFYCTKCNKEFIDSSSHINNRIRNGIEICKICNPPKLSNQYSYGELEVLKFVKSIYCDEIITNSRKIIPPYEIDIYIPKLKIAIEFNGVYYHSSNHSSKNNNYHKMKSDMCKKLGIHLIHIWDYEWVKKCDIFKSVLKNLINNQNQKIIYARKCIIKELDYKITNNFLNENHILGSLKVFSKSYGLFYDNELVSLMTFKKLRLNNNEYELSRYSIKKETRIIGGAEKLFKFFIKNNLITSIITYNDNSIFKGDVYKKLKFNFLRTNDPNYVYYDRKNNEIMKKQIIRKSVLGDEFISEKIYSSENELFKIYNAGNDVYIWKNII